MPLSPIQIKEKLLQAIDNDNNVIDTSTVLEVIGLLEKTAVTRDDLEATRLGYFVNNLRKKTTNQDLSKRCRKLVKLWQQVAGTIPSNNASPALSTSRSPAIPYTPPAPQLQSHHNASPDLQPMNARLALGDRAAAGRLVSPLVQQSGSRRSPAVTQHRRISPSNCRSSVVSRVSTPTPPTLSPNQSSSHTDTPNRTKRLPNHVGNHHETVTTPNNNHSNLTPNLDATNRTFAANKKRRRRSGDSITSDSSSNKKSRTVVNGESTRPVERIKTPRVKTTAELIADLQTEKRTRLTASDTITKIVTNQIQKEEDDINVSVVPASALPRFRRKAGLPNPPPAPADLSKTKSDLVHRFLQQTMQLGNGEDDELTHGLGKDTDVDVTTVGDDSTTGLTAQNGVGPRKARAIDMSIDPYSLLPPLDYDSIPWSDEETSEDGIILRNAITGEYPEGYEPTSVNEEEPGEDVTSKVINEEWHGVNGTVNVNNRFHTWTEAFTITDNAHKDENDVHVMLPYVDI